MAARPSKLLLRNLPFPALIALRYLRSTRRDAFASFLSLVAAGRLARGVMAMLLSLAVISGFQSALRAELLGRTPQIEVDLPPGADAEAARQAALRGPGVVSAQIQVRGGGWVVDRGKVQPVELVGFDGRVPRTFPGAAGRAEGLYVPATLAARWGLKAGDVLEVVSPRPTLTPLGAQPRLRSISLTGTYEGARTHEEKEPVALPRTLAESLLGTADRRLDVEAAGLDAALATAARLPAVLPTASKVLTWRDLNRPLL